MSIELLTKFLTLLFGYAMPALECFKAIEQRPGRADQLRFWCEYWVVYLDVSNLVLSTKGDRFLMSTRIILVLMVMFDEIAGVVISKIPMYYELKLAFLVYLWYPKTRGTDIVYATFLQPLVMQYQPNIEARLQYLRANAGDILVFYLKNFTERGYEVFLRVLDYVRSQASRGSKTRSFFSFRGGRAERPSFTDDYATGGDRRDGARHRQPRSGY